MQNETLTESSPAALRTAADLAFLFPLPATMTRPLAASRSGHGPTKIDWLARIHDLGPCFAARTVEHDQNDTFVADNFAALKAAHIFSAGIPASLGGGDASYAELCEMTRTLARYCSSTALALAMHFHQVAGLVWKWRHLNAPVDGLLERIVREQLVLIGSGGSDWLRSSGQAEAVPGGFRINARKVFASGSPAGDLLLTSAVWNDPANGPTILHFAIPMQHPQLKLISTWRTMGMRGTGSNDILIEDAFIPANAVSLRRPCGRWHAAMHLASLVALPMVYSVYLGLAEAARDLAIQESFSKRTQPESQYLAGEMETELFNARLAHQRMVQLGSLATPDPETTNKVLMARTLIAQSVLRVADKALELVGGCSYYRSFGLERIFRDIQAARFHPLPEKPQQQYTGHIAYGLDLDAD